MRSFFRRQLHPAGASVSAGSALPTVACARVLTASLTAGPLSFVAAGVGLLSLATLTWLSTWASSGLYLAGSLLLWLRVIALSDDRGAWAAFAAAATSWTAANFYYALVYYPGPPPVLSPSDIGYLAFPWLFSVGLMRYARLRLPRVPLSGWLDALTVALASGASLAAVIYASVAVRSESFAAVTTTLLYPVEDIVVVGLLLGVGTVLGWRLTIAARLMVAAIAAVTTADVLTLTRVLEGSTYGGAWPNAGWSAGLTLLVAAAWWPSAAQLRRRPAVGIEAIRLPTLAGLLALALVALSDPLGLGAISEGLATTAVLTVFLRLLLTVREVRALADTRRLAHTDDLTGLANRRHLLSDLRAACERGGYVLTLFDLDGFKHFNDTYGHVAGDRLLAALAAGLNGSLPSRGRAYRLGGDEFCTLVPAGSEADPARQRAVDALSASGEHWAVTTSWGSVSVADEATHPADALRIADGRMYELKRRRPGAARQQVRDALLLALGEQQPALATHTQDVTGLVEAVARRLGMSDAEVDDAVRAAELHDIGKLAMPAAILDKPGPLDPDEMAIIRTHTVVGERMLLAAPALLSVAPLVRASHERWDGGGYPDGLAGEAIPLGARIVAVCDSYDAMVAERPYRPPRTRDQAVAELRRCSGTQFDAEVVRVFLDCLS